MVHKRLLPATTLLMLIVASVSADKQGMTALGFGDWLGKQVKSTAGSKAGPSSFEPAYEYDGVEAHHTCLDGVALQNCGGSASSAYFESVLACCGEKSHGDQLVLKPTTIGQCDFTVLPLGDGVPVGENIVKTNTFFALCHFEKKADECGGPFCDKMVLSAQGDLYDISDAILSSAPSPPDGYLDCYLSLYPRAGGNVTERRSRMLSPKWATKHGSRSSEVTAKAAYAPDYEGADYHYPSKTFYKTDGVQVFYGPFTVNSRLHSAKYDQGWLQYVWAYALNPTPITEEEAGDAHVFDPYKYKLSFYKKPSY